VRRVPISQIKPAAYNPRKDLKPGDPDYEALRRSVERWDLVEPLVWNARSGNLVGGHQRLKILQQLGHTEADVSVVDLDEPDEKALNLALNRIQGAWDQDRLAGLLKGLNAEGFDLTLTGFNTTELEDLMGHVPDFFPVGEGEQGRLDEKKPVTCPECGHEFQA